MAFSYALRKHGTWYVYLTINYRYEMRLRLFRTFLCSFFMMYYFSQQCMSLVKYQALHGPSEFGSHIAHVCICLGYMHARFMHRAYSFMFSYVFMRSIIIFGALFTQCICIFIHLAVVVCCTACFCFAAACLTVHSFNINKSTKSIQLR